MKINQAILKDEETKNIYAIILFDDFVNAEDVQNVINTVKDEDFFNWNVEDVKEAICDNFNVKKILYLNNQDEIFYI